MRIDPESVPTKPFAVEGAHSRLAKLAGEWAGTATTIFDPSKPGMDAPWEGRIALLFNGRYARFTYKSSVEDKPIAGELTLAFESGEKQWKTSWLDSFHTSPAIMVSVGKDAPGPISVSGTYFAAEGHPHWGWRTEIDDSNPKELRIRMFNVEPNAAEQLGVDIKLARK